MKTDEKRKARKLRSVYGWSVRRIAKHVGVSKGSVSLWVRDIELTEKQKEHLLQSLPEFDECKAIELHKQGKKWTSIAREMGLTKSQMATWFNRKGFRRPRRKYEKCQICGNSNQEVKRKFCRSCQSTYRRFRTKLKAVKFLGGKCQRCGLELQVDEYAAYVFHHKDSSDKNFQLSQFFNLQWSKVEEEISKCYLWCSNCHQIFHSNAARSQKVIGFIKQELEEGVQLV